MAIKVCSECGFLAEEYQYQKTKGHCPRCLPDEAKNFRNKLKDKGLLRENY